MFLLLMNSNDILKGLMVDRYFLLVYDYWIDSRGGLSIFSVVVVVFIDGDDCLILLVDVNRNDGVLLLLLRLVYDLIDVNKLLLLLFLLIIFVVISYLY